MKTSPDDAVTRSSASRGPVDPGASTGPPPSTCPTCLRPYPRPVKRCTCGHLKATHNIETKAMACSLWSCDCTRYEPEAAS